MIKLEFFKNSTGIVKFVMQGHSGYSEGDDIVCASASAASWMCVNGIENAAKIKCGYQAEDGYIYFVLPDDLDVKSNKGAQLLLESFYLFSKELEGQYPEYIKVTELEV